jgi:hypothetical protein
MKKIALTQGKFAKVDDFNYEVLNKFKWYAKKSGKMFYAYRNLKGKSVLMHAFIVGTPKGKDTDHIDGDGLNNQENNLRICTHSQNVINRGKYKNNTSGFKGVFWDKKEKKWKVEIRVNKEKKYIGRFLKKEDGYMAYCEACIKYHGEFSNLK